MSTPPSPPGGPILFYDGNCGLCARSVAWCLRRDRRRVLRFAPLQGETYAIAGGERPTDLSTVTLLDGDGLHVRSEAVLRALRAVGGPWAAIAAVARLIPRGLRDAVYRYVAAHRMGWFGPAEACDLPTAEDRSRFLP